MTSKIHTTYRELDVVPIHEDIPELGVVAGDLSVVDFVYDEGRRLHVEIGREDGTTAGFAQLEAETEADGAFLWHVMSYSPFGR